MADDLGLPGYLRVDSQDLHSDFHGGVEGAVDGCLDCENGSDCGWLEKTHVVDRDRCDFASGMGAGGNAGCLVEKRCQVSAEYKIVGVDVGGVNDVAGFDLRLLDCLCVFHIRKINIVVGEQGLEFLYSGYYGRKKDL